MSDITLHDALLDTIGYSGLDAVVCLALDRVYTPQGTLLEEPPPELWVSNDYILMLQNDMKTWQPKKDPPPEVPPPKPPQILFGASVHPYDPNFNTRVKKCVDDGAVLLKWVPSSQQIDMADPRVKEALEFLATAKHGKPLPLLLHTAREWSIPSTDRSTTSFDYLRWTLRDRIINFFRGKKRFRTPDIKRVHQNLRSGLRAGGIIIFAHVGLPYFFWGFLGKIFEHSDFPVVRKYLEWNLSGKWPGKCYADISACCTPVRKRFFPDILKLPEDYVLFGSDYPVPAFELYNDLPEVMADLKAAFQGDLGRLIIPQDNPLAVNYRELNKAFSGHPLFSNFAKLIDMD